MERPDATARLRTGALVTGDGLRETNVLDPARRLTREPAHVEEMHDAVRRVERPELGPVRREREAVSRRVGPEARVPGEALEARDVELLLRGQVEDTNAEQPTRRLVGDARLPLLDSQGVRGSRGGLREARRPRQREGSNAPVLLGDVE